jgi:hypothetical protein
VQKIGAIFLISIILSGCSVSRRSGTRSGILPRSISLDSLIIRTIANNVSSESFVIKKAELEIRNGNIDEKLLLNIKQHKEGNFLFSIHGKSGIEAARVLISKDSILVNDRIKKKYFYSGTDYLTDHYGIPVSYIPIIFGDFVYDKRDIINSDKCSNGRLKVISFSGDTQIEYIIDCQIGKVVFTETKDIMTESKIEMKFSNFMKIEKFFVARMIEITDSGRNLVCIIKIMKIEALEDDGIGDPGLIPGKNYLKLPLL